MLAAIILNSIYDTASYLAFICRIRIRVHIRVRVCFRLCPVYPLARCRDHRGQPIAITLAQTHHNSVHSMNSDQWGAREIVVCSPTYGSWERHYHSRSWLLIHVHMVMRSHLFLCTKTAEEACLSIARSKDACVKMLHAQLNFPWLSFCVLYILAETW